MKWSAASVSQIEGTQEARAAGLELHDCPGPGARGAGDGRQGKGTRERVMKWRRCPALQSGGEGEEWGSHLAGAPEAVGQHENEDNEW